LTGLSVAVRRRLPYDVRLVRMRGEPDQIERDLWTMGTALSAPVIMLVTHATATWLVATRCSRIASALLGVLGAVNIAGYLGERVVRERLHVSGWDPVETPVAAVGLGLAALMGLLGLGGVRAGQLTKPAD
jgi:hypothetical protein